MNPVAHIRKSVFGVSQVAFGEIAGVTQATVSRWERGELSPNLDELRRVRDEARQRGLAWDDSLIFAAPAAVNAQAAA